MKIQTSTEDDRHLCIYLPEWTILTFFITVLDVLYVYINRSSQMQLKLYPQRKVYIFPCMCFYFYFCFPLAFY